MFSNYLKLGWRNLAKNSTYSIIIISGLVLAYSACLVIFLFVENEMSYDRQSPDADRIYRVVKDFVNDDGTSVPDATTPPAFGPVLAREIPGIESVVRIWPPWGERLLMSSGPKEFYESNVFLADSNIISFFNLKVVKGNAEKALRDPKQIVLTESTAKRYFGDEDPIGKSIGIDSAGKNLRVVSAIIADLPANMHFHLDMIGALWTSENPDDKWNMYMYYTYIKLKEGVDIRDVDPEIVKSFARNRPNRNNKYYTQAVTDIHLQSKLKWELEPNGDRAFVNIFITIGIFIFLIASVNYINLSIVQGLNRSKEVGIRKVSGAIGKELVNQFLLESIIISLASFALAMIIVSALTPSINIIFNQHLPSLFDAPWYYPAIMFLIVIVAGLLSGLYPAVYLAAFKPASVLKGVFQPGSGNLWIRKSLVILQFSISIALIAGAAVVFTQVDYLQSKDLGFNKNQVIVIQNLSNFKNTDALKGSIRQVNGVAGVASSFAVLGGQNGTTQFSARGVNLKTQTNFAGVDANYIDVMGFHLIAGRNFSATDRVQEDGATKIIVNETAAMDLGISDNPIGAMITTNPDDERPVYNEVIGVVKDFHFTSLRSEIKPYVFMLEEKFVTNLVVRSGTSDYVQLLKDLEQAWINTGAPGPFEYFFLDDQFSKLYSSEENFQLIFFVFTVISIYIACSGLFAVASYFIKRRTKEIGIRKALGASTSQVTWLVSSGFLQMVIVANLLAWPATWMFMNDWLNGFAYRVEMNWGILAMSGVVALLIAVITIGGQSVKAAQANPIQSLRNE